MARLSGSVVALMCDSLTGRLQQALPRDDALETLTSRNCYLEERIHTLESHKEPSSRPSVGVCVDCDFS